MALRINRNTRVYLESGDILPRMVDRLTVLYNQKEYKVIGYLDDCERLILQDIQEPDCELIVGIENVKPLLRKMESMTSDEKEIYQSLLDGVVNHTKGVWEVTEWLNKNMFDYKGLIGEGLAEEM